jgi:hypothetical protein
MIFCSSLLRITIPDEVLSRFIRNYKKTMNTRFEKRVFIQFQELRINLVLMKYQLVNMHQYLTK